MHEIEPHYNWRNLYVAEEDENSPFFGRQYSEFEFSNAIYDHVLHPQWDEFGSPSLYLKILFVSYNDGFCIIEFIGEWNDCLHNDIMHLKRNVLEPMMDNGIKKFVLIGENVLIFHSSDDCYYEEWFDEIEDGWIAMINFREIVESDMSQIGIDNYVMFNQKLDDLRWRTFNPDSLCTYIDSLVNKLLPS